MTRAKKLYAEIKADPARLADYTRRAATAGLNIWLLVSQECMRTTRASTSAEHSATPDASGRDSMDTE